MKATNYIFDILNIVSIVHEWSVTNEYNILIYYILSSVRLPLNQ